MANRSRQRAMRRNQIIMGVFAILLILSMVISLVWSFSPPPPSVSTVEPPTAISVTPAP